VADIERFTLKLSHSFNSPLIGKFGVSTDFQGLFAACETNHPKDVMTECKRTKIPNTRGTMAPEDEVGLLSTEKMGAPSLKGASNGEDEISVHDLLKMSPVGRKYDKVAENVLDSQLPADFGHAHKSLREAGGMMLLDVDYANDGYQRPGIPIPGFPGIKPITYMYRPYFVPTNRNQMFQLVEESDHADIRTIDIWYGITIKMQFNGKLVAFTWVKMLKALTAGLVLLTMASTLVVYIASYLMPMQEKYNALMYQMSEDMSSYANLRQSRSSCIGSYMNPLGLLDDKAWLSMESVFMTGTMLWKYLSEQGAPNKELPNSEIIKILCMNEVRLNRLDAMDTRMMFAGSDPEAEQKHRVYKCITSAKDAYYEAAKDLKKMPVATS